MTREELLSEIARLDNEAAEAIDEATVEAFASGRLIHPSSRLIACPASRALNERARQLREKLADTPVDSSVTIDPQATGAAVSLGAAPVPSFAQAFVDQAVEAARVQRAAAREQSSKIVSDFLARRNASPSLTQVDQNMDERRYSRAEMEAAIVKATAQTVAAAAAKAAAQFSGTEKSAPPPTAARSYNEEVTLIAKRIAACGDPKAEAESDAALTAAGISTGADEQSARDRAIDEIAERIAAA